MLSKCRSHTMILRKKRDKVKQSPLSGKNINLGHKTQWQQLGGVVKVVG
uniref:Uncharacterized protein n=1 Tax=Rhizophora mucronata TaxID=61149 RepID=A0A2P2QXJ4_RHIMU